jgi:tRNA nucleotidyltransferase (CCA-adding enzyme)
MNVAELLRRGISGEKLDLLERLGRTAEASGERLYLVGGAVRDLMIGGRGPDLDLVLQGDAVRFAGDAASALGFGFDRHPAFGTATILPGGDFRMDIATARREAYAKPGALPDVVPDIIEADLQRRDFTINAMALCLLPSGFGEIVDPFGGADDLKKKFLRVLHDGSFVDDPTRILRGIRFSGRLNFSFDERTEKLIREALARRVFDTVSGARIKKEMKMIFEEHERGRVVTHLRAFGIGNSILPGFEFSLDLFKVADLVREAAFELSGGIGEGEVEPWLAGFAAAAAGNSPPVLEELAERLGATGKESEVLTAAGGSFFKELAKSLGHKNLKPSQVASALDGLPIEVILCCYAYGGDNERGKIRKYIKETRNVRLEVSGDELVSRGHNPSKRMGEAIGAVLRLKQDGLVGGKEAEIEAAENHLKEDC